MSRLSVGLNVSDDPDRGPLPSIIPLSGQEGVGFSGYDDAESDDSLHETVMAVEVRSRGLVGCSYYVAQTRSLFVANDLPSGGTAVLDAYRLYCQPTVILLSAKVDEQAEAVFDPRVGTLHPSDGCEIFARLYTIEKRPTSDFNFASAKRQLSDLLRGSHIDEPEILVPDQGITPISDPASSLPGLDRSLNYEVRLAGLLDLSNEVSIGCAGAVLAYLQRRRDVEELPGQALGGSVFGVQSLQSFTLQDILTLSPGAFSTLQVMQNDASNATLARGPREASSGIKEAASVFELFKPLARTPQGKQVLQRQFLRPSTDIATITARQYAIATLLRPENDQCLQSLTKGIGAIKNMRTILAKLRRGAGHSVGQHEQVKTGIWANLRAFAYHALGVRQAVLELVSAEQMVIRDEILESFDTRLIAQLGTDIHNIVDFDESTEKYRTVVHSGVDVQLDEMRRRYHGLESLLDCASREVGSSLPDIVSANLNIVYLPQIGFLISIPKDSNAGQAQYMGSDDATPWQCMFSTADRAYFKDARMQDLDESLGDVYGMIVDKEIEIIHALCERILEHEDALGSISDLCGEVDALIALTRAARLFRLVRPQMTEGNCLSIKGGRHILHERTIDAYVANDCSIKGREDLSRPPNAYSEAQASAAHRGQEDAARIILLTGPNQSGKSVYIKQVALIVFLAHVGSFVPADSAIIGITDKILLSNASQESVSQARSAFMTDLQQMKSILSAATSRSLLVIDEFGKGTNPADGAGILSGILDFLSNDTCAMPKALVATHFHEIIDHNLLSPCNERALMHMDIRTDEAAVASEEQVVYLYTLRPGRSFSSFGIVCAAMNGIKDAVLHRAEQLLMLSNRGADLTSACARISQDELSDWHKAEHVAKQFVCQDFDEETMPEHDKNTWNSFLDDILTDD